MLLALAWTVFTFWLAAWIWRAGKQHSHPELGFSSRENERELFFARFVRKMSFTAVGLCLLSALLVWNAGWFVTVLPLLAIPAVGAFQFFRSKKSITSSGNRSLPRVR